MASFGAIYRWNVMSWHDKADNVGLGLGQRTICITFYLSVSFINSCSQSISRKHQTNTEVYFIFKKESAPFIYYKVYSFARFGDSHV